MNVLGAAACCSTAAALLGCRRPPPRTKLRGLRSAWALVVAGPHWACILPAACIAGGVLLLPTSFVSKLHPVRHCATDWSTRSKCTAKCVHTRLKVWALVWAATQPNPWAPRSISHTNTVPNHRWLGALGQSARRSAYEAGGMGPRRGGNPTQALRSTSHIFSQNFFQKKTTLAAIARCSPASWPAAA